MAAVLSILLVLHRWVHEKLHPEKITYWFPGHARHMREVVWFHLNTHSSVYSQDRLTISKHVERWCSNWWPLEVRTGQYSQFTDTVFFLLQSEGQIASLKEGWESSVAIFRHILDMNHSRGKGQFLHVFLNSHSSDFLHYSASLHSCILVLLSATLDPKSLSPSTVVSLSVQLDAHGHITHTSREAY